MTHPINQRPPLDHLDEARRQRARGIQKLGQAYKEGAAYNDIHPEIPAEALNAEYDYDKLSKLKVPKRRYRYPR